MKGIWYKYTCPNCGHEENHRPFDWSYENGKEFVDRPHENPAECISYLRSIIDDIVLDVKRLKYPNS